MGSDWESCFGLGNSGEDMADGDYRTTEQKRLDKNRSNYDYSADEDEEDDNEREEGHTYEKWVKLGYHVKKGQKASYKHYGNSIFTKSQVKKIR